MASSEPASAADAPRPPAKRRMPLGRIIDRFLTNPSSGRYAILLIVVADVAVVLVFGLIIWTVDRSEFQHLTEAFWYILQTVTTVGYGDVTPVDMIGRLVGAAVMLLGIAFLSILTATITSSFIEARQAARLADEAAAERAHRARLETRLEELIDRLDRIEALEREDGDRRDG